MKFQENSFRNRSVETLFRNDSTRSIDTIDMYSPRHKNTIQVRGRTAWWLLVLFYLMGAEVSGCRPSETETAFPARPVWSETVTAIRTGKSHELRMTESPLTAEQAKDLSIDCQSIQVLEIDQSELSLEKLVAMLKSLPQLRQVKLMGSVNNEQLAAITESRPSLRVLNLPKGTFDDAGLSSVEWPLSLELLRFHSQQVTDSSMSTIASIAQLRFLHLIDVSITDDGLLPLYEMRNLKSFYLDGSQCSEEGLSELIRQRPELHFHWNQLHLDHDPQGHEHD